MERSRGMDVQKHCHTMVLGWLSLCLLLVTLTNCNAQTGEGMVRIRDLRKHLGQAVTIKGRTGQIMERWASESVGAYSLRDDYGDMVVVLFQRTPQVDYPIMGVTYQIKGVPELRSGTIILLERERQRWIDPLIRTVRVTIIIIAAAIVLILGGLYFIKRRVSREVSEAVSEVLPEPWGFAEVLAGPDQGKRFPLRYDEVLVGRGLDPVTGVAIDNDNAVSRPREGRPAHGRILRDSSNRVFYEDLGSTFGSAVNEIPVQPGQRVHLPSGALIRLGPNTVIRIVPVGGVTRDETVLGEGIRTGQQEGDERPTRPATTPPSQQPGEGTGSPEGDNRPTV